MLAVTAVPAQSRGAATARARRARRRPSRARATWPSALSRDAGEAARASIAQSVDRLHRAHAGEQHRAQPTVSPSTGGCSRPCTRRIAVERDGIRARQRPLRRTLRRRRARRRLVGRKLTDLRPPGLRRAASPSTCGGTSPASPRPARLEVELQPIATGARRGSNSRSRATTLRRQPALLIVGRRDEPARATGAGARARTRAPGSALDSLAEGVLTTDRRRPHRLRQSGGRAPASASPTARSSGRTLGDVIELVDEADRKALGDPVRQALTTGARVNVGRRGMLVSSERRRRALDRARRSRRCATPSGEVDGTVIALRDVSDLRGLTRADVLPGEPRCADRPRQSSRVRAATARRRSRPRTAAARATCCATSTSTASRRSTTNAGTSRATACCARSRRSSRTRCATPTPSGASAATSSAILLSAARSRRRGRSPTTWCARSATTASSGRTRSSTIGVSIGLVEVSHESGSIEDLIGAADSACYVAKKQGAPRARVLGAGRGRGAAARRDPLAAAAAVGAQGKPLRAVRAADRRTSRRHARRTAARASRCCCG